MSKISIVIPVYYNADTLMLLYEDMKQKILGKLGDYELVFVDDGSGLALFIQAIPFNFYALLTIFFVFFMVIWGKDFGSMRAAEAKAHGKTPETVMFHEVGAVDSIVDVCSVAICLDDLGIEDIVVESLSEGHGTIRCAHGLMPIPVPAVVNLCQAGNIALTPAPVAGELVTPTGAAVVAALRTSEHLPARYRIEAVGYGAGKRPYEGCSGTLRCLLVHADA